MAIRDTQDVLLFPMPALSGLRDTQNVLLFPLSTLHGLYDTQDVLLIPQPTGFGPSFCALPPDQSNYAGQFGHEVVSTQMDGGASRFRADQLGGSFLLTVQWTVNKKNYNYICAFYRTNKSTLFTIGLYLDSADIQLYSAHFVPDTFGLTSQAGDTFVVGAQLEVLPNSAYNTNDVAVLEAGPDV